MASKPDKTGNKQTDSRFKPGKSGNPRGRPKGARNKTTLAVQALLEGEGEALARKAVEMALNGDSVALRLCLERVYPARKDVAVTFDLPEMTGAESAAHAIGSILESVSNGELTPLEATTLSNLVEGYRKALETKELEARIAQLEEARQ